MNCINGHRRLISESKDNEQALYVIAAATGLRIGEILGLEARHILNGAAVSWSNSPLIGSVLFRASRRRQQSATSM